MSACTLWQLMVTNLMKWQTKCKKNLQTHGNSAHFYELDSFLSDSLKILDNLKLTIFVPSVKL